MKNLFAVMILVSLSFEAQGIRFVGNGGGEAEMKIVSYLESLPTWLDFCAATGSQCIKNLESSFWKSFLPNYRNLQITEVEFVNEKDFNSVDLTQSTDGNKLVLTFESLYVDNKNSKSEKQLVAILINKIFKAANEQISLSSEEILILPKFKKHPQLELYAFSFGKENKLFSPSKDLNTKLNNKSELNDFQILSETSSGYMIQDLNTHSHYEIYISGEQLILYPVY